MAQPRTRKRPPRLDHRVLQDPDALGVALGELLDAEPGLRRHRRKIIRLQNRLRTLSSAKAWSVYLSLEATEASRWNDALDLVAQWAFLQGRRRTRLPI